MTVSIGEMLQNSQPQASGWSRAGASLGSVLAGRNPQLAFDAGALREAQTQTALMAARKARDAQIGRQAMAKAAFDAGDSELANAFLQGAGDNLAQIGSYRLDKQKLGWGDQAMQAATASAPDLDLLNRINIVREGKPVDLTKIEDHTVLNPMVTPGQQNLSTNEIGQALIGKTAAEAGAARALAGERAAHAHLYGVQADAGGFADSAREPSLVAPFAEGDSATGEAVLQSLDPNERAIVQAVVDGRYPIPTGRAAASPQWQRIVNAAVRVDPSFDASNYQGRAKARTDFSAMGKGGQQIVSLNTLGHHAQDVLDAIEGLKNRSSPTYNEIVNSMLSATGDPRIAQFDTAANTFASEYAKLLKGGVPSVPEIEEQRKNLNSAMSPDQLRAVMSTMGSQIEGRLSELERQQQESLGLGAKAHGIQIVSPDAKSTFDAMIDGRKVARGANHRADAGGHRVGDVLTVKGRQYRVVGGDPNDPDLEPLQ